MSADTNQSPVTQDKYNFGFDSYIDSLETVIRKHLYSDNSTKSLVIGLHAQWGSGKTHLLEGIEQCVNHKNSEESIVIPVIFNAWRFEKEEHLIIPLLKSLYWRLDGLAKEKEGEFFKYILESTGKNIGNHSPHHLSQN